MLNFIRKIRIDIQKHILIINKLASFSTCGKLKPHSVELKMCRVNEKNAYICINYSVINKFKQMCIMATEEKVLLVKTLMDSIKSIDTSLLITSNPVRKHELELARKGTETLINKFK